MIRIIEGEPLFEGGEKVWLITPEQFVQLPDGTELTSIRGEKKIKGKDDIDQDIRFGYLAFGFLEKDKPAGIQFDERGTWVIGKEF